MFELSLDTFKYKDYNTINIDGKRIYHISEEQYYPSITTMLGHTLETEKKNILEAWKNRIGKKEADKISTDACNRGTNIHLLLERYLRNEDLDIKSFKDEHIKLFNSLKLYLKRINKIYGQEVVLFSDTLGIAGRCDLVAEYDGELAIIDYKTSSRVKSSKEIGDYWIQACFYAISHNEMFNTNIKKLIIMMGVENKLPMIFKKTINDNLMLELSERVYKFYESL